MKILTAAEMRETDRVTIETYGIASDQLMTQAGGAVARFVLRQYPAAQSIAAICGMGNNGGDGLMAAGALKAAGRDVHVLLLGRRDDLKGDPLMMLRKAEPMVPVIELVAEGDLHTPAVAQLFVHGDLILDAMVGTGFKPPLRGLAAAVRDLIQPMPTPVLAVDLPSGWDAD